MNGKRNLAFAIGGIIAVVFSAAMFVLWIGKDGIFWITYLFLLLGIAGTTMNAAFLKSDDSYFASNLTLLTISALYLAVCAIVSLFGIFVLHIKIAGYLILHIIAFALFLCVWLIARSAVDYINRQDR